MSKWYEKLGTKTGNVWNDVTGVTQAHAATKAGNIQADQQQKALDEQRRQFEITQNNLQPWLQTGTRALGRLEQGMNSNEFSMPDFSFSGGDFQNDPGYQFQMQQGARASDAGAASRGGALGGNQLRALTTFGQGLASTGYNDAYNRAASTYGLNSQNRQSSFGRYSQLAGLGQQTGAQLGQFGANFGAQAANAYGNIGDARAGGMIGAANARNQGVGNLLNLGAKGLGAYLGA